MKKNRLINRISYLFDNLMSRGTIALIGWLTLISLIATLLISSIAWFIGIAYGDNLFHQFWVSIMYTLTTSDPTEGYNWGSKIALMFILFIGIFATSILIGILTAGIEDKMQSLRKGRSRVIESGHVIILGWSSYIFSIISELISANINQKKSCIVILAEKDKVEMEDEIHEKIKNFGKTKIVCRTGNPIENVDLELTNPNTSKAIIILRAEGDISDFNIIKTLLSIVRNPDRREKQYHIVTEIHEQGSIEIAKIIGKNEIEFVFTKQFISRLIAQTCLQTGLSSVYSELLEFSGNEIYIKDIPEKLIGKTFDDALFAFDNSIVIGICEKNQIPILNPQLKSPIKKDDKIIMIAEDDEIPEVIEFSNKTIENNQIASIKPEVKKNENIIILGWNDSVPVIISELDNYITKGSKIIIASNLGKNEIKNNINFKLKNIEISIIIGDTTSRNFLNSLPLKKASHAIVIPYTNTLDIQNADASTLTTLLLLRDIRTKEGYSFSIVSEMIDIKNRKLIEVERIDDFVVSEKLVGLILSQIAENKILAEIFTILLNPGNVEIYIKPILNYIKTEKDVNFYTITEAAKRHKEIAIGYRISSLSNDPSKKYGIVLNPNKNDLIKFTKEDFIIVIAEC